MLPSFSRTPPYLSPSATRSCVGKVLNKDKFVDKVIPKYFGQSNYVSFNRQLIGWGFKRLHRKGPGMFYYLKCFLRGHPRLTLTALMRRIPAGQGRATPNTDEEPDFYAIAEHQAISTSKVSRCG
ncbi:hypothetical protein ACHAXM_001598 [Skeletonema potamos]